MGFDRKAFGRLMKRPGFTPTDCPNFIKYRNEKTYRWYGRATVPLLLVTGGGPMFIGKTKNVLWGEYDFDSWMVVRYPSHQGMLKMIINPYYMIVCNPIRERAVANFELAFTRPVDPDSGLQRHANVLAFHANPTNPGLFRSQIRSLAGTVGLKVVYESDSVYDFDFITNPRPSDPSALTYPTTIALAGDTKPILRDFARQEEITSLLEEQDVVTAVLYERASKFDMVKFR